MNGKVFYFLFLIFYFSIFNFLEILDFLDHEGAKVSKYWLFTRFKELWDSKYLESLYNFKYFKHQYFGERAKQFGVETYPQAV